MLERQEEFLERLYPFARMNVDSKNMDVLACRHLMYYEKSGKSFENLKQGIKKSLDKNRDDEREL